MNRPRWIIDDTSGISDARVFVAHTAEPRFFAEMMDDDEADLLGGITISVGMGQTLCRIEWIDEPAFDADELIQSFNAAIHRHWSIRGGD